MNIVVRGKNITKWNERIIKEDLRHYLKQYDLDFLIVYS